MNLNQALCFYTELLQARDIYRNAVKQALTVMFKLVKEKPD